MYECRSFSKFFSQLLPKIVLYIRDGDECPVGMKLASRLFSKSTGTSGNDHRTIFE